MYKTLRQTLFVGKELVHLPTCQSTNDTMARMIQNQDLNEGLIVITEDQTHGKGQRGNIWKSRKGENLTFSLYLKPHFLDISQQFYLNACISLGIYHALYEYVSEAVKIKWPNDIFLYQNKMGGILIENNLRGSQIEHSIIGIGLNVNQKDFDFPSATSLSNVIGQNIDKEELLVQLAKHIEAQFLKLKKLKLRELKEAYMEKLFGWREVRKFEDKKGVFEGEITGIDEFGRLELWGRGKKIVYDLKEVVFL
jgi:BirA family transcriptional regulator, biotin operon repressor / biotin---[acetyl-CoA-carboxylase] ligase